MAGSTLVRASKVFDPEVTEADALLVEDGRIARVGTWADLENSGAVATLDLRPLSVLPGLLDTHVHITGSGTRSAPEDRRTEPLETHLLRAAGNGWRALQEGVTTVRDCGALNEVIFAYRDAARRRILAAPRVLASGSPLTRTGGHGHWWGGEADTPDEIQRVIRRQSKLGADCIKVMVDNGLDQRGKARPGLLLFTAEDLSAIVAEASDWGLPVVAHCLSLPGIRAATSAGVHSIEHAIFYDPDRGATYDPELVEEIAERGIWVNPGQTFAYEAIANPEPSERFARNAELFETRLEHDAAMLAAGVRLVSGTDAGTYATRFGLYHLAPRLYAERIGMTPVQALRASTSDAALSIGLGGVTGELKPGLAADLIAVDGNPSVDIRALERVCLTMLDGVVVHDNCGTLTR